LGKNQDVYASRKKGVFLAAKSNNSIVGTIGLRSLATSDELSSQLRVRYKNPSEIGLVNRLCVTSNLRGQGIGKNLFKNVVDKAKGYGYPILYLNASTTPNSVSFWEKMGFKKFFEENDRYRTTHMELQI
jgi:N-acetylglutamate synthase-like GNAT family acetyltransferase